MTIRSIIFIISVLVSLVACKEPSAESQESTPDEVMTLPADFETFYEKFHDDTAFQIEHISFPLAGKPSRADLDMEVVDFRWTRAGWKYHQAFAEDDDTYDRTFYVMTPDLIMERIVSPDYGYYMERRFAKLSDGWNLIYYADIQEGKSE